MVYKLPKSKIYNRLDFIKNYCREKKVVHVGACQGNDENNFDEYDEKASSDNFVHTIITKASSKAVGIDFNQKFIDYLKEKHNVTNIFFGDIEKKDTLSSIDFEPDVIVFGEILEHFTNPGLALTNIADNIMTKNSKLLITIPNGLSAWNFFWTFFGKEAHDRDHSLLFTPRIIEKLLEKNNLKCKRISYYNSTTQGINHYKSFKLFRLKSWIPFIYLNICLRINSAFSDGLLIEVERNAI
jgi:2-polyprenyl-3-methyl-5-hydroxy-6-metoxy-1,4-benzoquinol methylase